MGTETASCTHRGSGVGGDVLVCICEIEFSTGSTFSLEVRTPVFVFEVNLNELADIAELLAFLNSRSGDYAAPGQAMTPSWYFDDTRLKVYFSQPQGNQSLVQYLEINIDEPVLSDLLGAVQEAYNDCDS